MLNSRTHVRYHTQARTVIMLAVGDLVGIAQARLEDAQTLARAGRFDGAVYLCGYAVELALKARICNTLSWTHFPETQKEFESLTSCRTHDLTILLRLSGGRPESRYKQIGTASAADASDMTNATTALLGTL